MLDTDDDIKIQDPSVPLKHIVEGALLAAGRPLNIDEILSLFLEGNRPDKKAVEEVISEIEADCEGKGFELKKVASGWRFQVRQSLSPWISRLWEEKPQRYSRALLETLSLVAYRQPITRGDIEEIRGVAVSTTIIRTLLEREWVRVVGHKDVPGRPALYATTRNFLDYFSMKSLEDLPTLTEIRDLDELSRKLDFGDGSHSPEGGEIAAKVNEANKRLLDIDYDALEEAEALNEIDDVDRTDDEYVDNQESQLKAHLADTDVNDVDVEPADTIDKMVDNESTLDETHNQ